MNDDSALSPQLLLDPDVIEDPVPFYGRLRRDAPVWRVPGTDVVTVATFDALAEAVARTEDFSSNIEALLYRDENGLPARIAFGLPSGGAQTLATADPPVHAVHRSTVFPELVARRMIELEPEVTKLARARLRGALDGDSTFDFMAEVGNVVPITVISWLIGLHDIDTGALLRAAFDSTEMLSATMPLAVLESMLQRTSDVGVWLAERLREAVESPREDLLGAVAHGIGRGDLTFEQGVTVIHTLLSAGGESTSSLLGNAVRILAEDPELQQRVRDDRSLIGPFIEEALRLESPFRYHMRSVRTTTTLAGTEVEAGTTMLLLWGSANRDPAEFPDADTLMLDRPTPRHHVGFGRGVHHCVGAPLARLEARVVLTALLDQTERFILSDDPPRRVHSLMVRRHETLPLECSAR